jgi:hypothetical protein
VEIYRGAGVNNHIQFALGAFAARRSAIDSPKIDDAFPTDIFPERTFSNAAFRRGAGILGN